MTCLKCTHSLNSLLIQRGRYNNVRNSNFGGPFINTKIKYNNGTVVRHCGTESSPYGFGLTDWDMLKTCNDTEANIDNYGDCTFGAHDVRFPLHHHRIPCRHQTHVSLKECVTIYET